MPESVAHIGVHLLWVHLDDAGKALEAYLVDCATKTIHPIHIGDCMMTTDKPNALLARIYEVKKQNGLAAAMSIADDLLGGYGVEYIPSRQDTYREALGLEYVNMGDTYTPTVVYDHAFGLFRLCRWGDVVEKYPDRFGTETE